MHHTWNTSRNISENLCRSIGLLERRGEGWVKISFLRYITSSCWCMTSRVASMSFFFHLSLNKSEDFVIILAVWWARPFMVRSIVSMTSSFLEIYWKYTRKHCCSQRTWETHQGKVLTYLSIDMEETCRNEDGALWLWRYGGSRHFKEQWI